MADGVHFLLASPVEGTYGLMSGSMVAEPLSSETVVRNFLFGDGDFELVKRNVERGVFRTVARSEAGRVCDERFDNVALGAASVSAWIEIAGNVSAIVVNGSGNILAAGQSAQGCHHRCPSEMDFLRAERVNCLQGAQINLWFFGPIPLYQCQVRLLQASSYFCQYLNQTRDVNSRSSLLPNGYEAEH